MGDVSIKTDEGYCLLCKTQEEVWADERHLQGTGYQIEAYCKTENRETALEHKDDFGKGSDGTRGIVTGIREIPTGPERPKKSWGCGELKRELNKVQMSSGDRGPNGGIRHGRGEGKRAVGQKGGLRKRCLWGVQITLRRGKRAEETLSSLTMSREESKNRKTQRKLEKQQGMWQTRKN